MEAALEVPANECIPSRKIIDVIRHCRFGTDVQIFDDRTFLVDGDLRRYTYCKGYCPHFNRRWQCTEEDCPFRKDEVTLLRLHPHHHLTAFALQKHVTYHKKRKLVTYHKSPVNTAAGEAQSAAAAAATLHIGQEGIGRDMVEREQAVAAMRAVLEASSCPNDDNVLDAEWEAPPGTVHASDNIDVDTSVYTFPEASSCTDNDSALRWLDDLHVEWESEAPPAKRTKTSAPQPQIALSGLGTVDGIDLDPHTFVEASSCTNEDDVWRWFNMDAHALT